MAKTAKQVLLFQGEPAFTQFSASNGGWLAEGGQPYLVAKKDPYDNAYRGWHDTVTAGEIERAFPAIGSLRRDATRPRPCRSITNTLRTVGGASRW